MSDLERYLKKRKRRDHEFAEGFEVGYSNFKVRILLRQSREKGPRTQDDVAHGSNLQISGAGYGVHWPDLDEDIGIEGLLLGKHSSQSPSSFERWLQRRREKVPQDEV